MPDINLSNEAVLPELYFLIAHFLNNTPFKETAQHLIRQLEQRKVLPSRIDWTGRQHDRSFQEMADNLSLIPSNFLLQMCNQLKISIENQFDAPSTTSLNSLLGIGQFSIFQDVQKLKKKQENSNKTSNLDVVPRDFYLNFHSSNRNYFNNSKQSRNGGMNLILNLNKRQLDGRLTTQNIIQPELYKSINIHKRILGHLSAVYCVCFDRTGRYILTGADDNLIKAWSAFDGRLLATFRGHEKEISDIDINFENTLLASGSCDKMIRIWNLKTTENLSILQSHSAMVTSIEFSPYCRGNNRWLASSGNDGVICFWYWNSETLEFNPKPKRFIEKSRPGGQILCLSFSSGGLFLAAGSNDHAIRVYCFENGDPIKICELESHTNLVDSIQYANKSARFLSGSKDGTAKIWSFESQQWKNILIDGSKTLQKTEVNEYFNSDICKRYSVTMVAWNCDDSLVITAQNNFIIKIWNSTDAQLIHELKGHNDEIFVLEAHPKDPRLLLSAGHDGHVILWNILTGKLIKKFYNRIENEGHGCLFDTKWSSTLDMFASTDSHGNLTIFGFGNDDNFRKIPNQLFFHTDYRPLMRDSNSYVLDEQTQTPPHLMPPPFLVDADGNPYDSELQRLVPGRENLTDAQLIPHIITNENGVSEIIGDRESDDNPANQANAQEQNQQNNIEHTRQIQNRRRNAWIKNLIRPLELGVLRTSEIDRNQSLFEEETNYKRELKEIELSHQKGSLYIYRDGENSSNRDNNNYKRRRGKPKKNDYSGPGGSAENTESMPPIHMDYDEDTLDDQYIDIDDDSNTRHSIDPLPTISGIASTSSNNINASNANNRPNNRPRRTVYIEPNDISDSDRTSEYSDWAEQDGRKTLRPPPRKSRHKSNKKNKHKRILRVVDDDDGNENVSNRQELDSGEEDEEETRKISKTKSKTSLSKKLKKIVSDEDDDEVKKEAEHLNENEQDEEEYSSESDGDEDSLYEDENAENEENVDPNKPCTSRAADSRSLKSPKKNIKKHKKRGRPPINSKLSDINNYKKSLPKTPSKINKIAPVKECPAEYRPPEWLTSTKPKKSPYVPQIGDEVVYFRQGHELYVQTVKGSYEVEEKILPWVMTNKTIGVQEFCKVINIKIEIKPPRLVCLKLCVIDRQSGISTGPKFTIKYHDTPGVADFVILRQFYEKAIERNWRPKDRFRCIIDDVWYIGVIDSKRPFQEEYPDSQFQCLTVTWDSTEVEALSPWDLEPLSGSRKTKPVSSSSIPVNGESIAVTPEEVKSLLYVPHDDEWPGGERDLECERILNGLEKIMELSIAEPFNYPVDLDEFPTYAIVIKYPIDLNTIKERLENRYYRRLNAVEWDIRKIEENAHDYNEPDSSIYQQSTLLTNLLIEFINDPDCTNPMPIYKRLCKNLPLQENEEGDQNSSSKKSRTRQKSESNLNNSNNNQAPLRFNLRSRQNVEELNKNEDNQNNAPLSSYSWHDECKKLINDIMKHQDSIPFRSEVDINEYLDYLEIVKHPIDFGKIRSQLLYNFYRNDINRFEKDCNRVFNNSRLYNTNKRSKIYSMTLRLQTFYKERMAIIRNKYEASQAEKSKFGKRKSRLQQNINDYQNKNEQSNYNTKTEINSESNNNNNHNTNNHSFVNSNNLNLNGPTTSGYVTRSSSNRKIKSINSNSNHHHNENTENSLSQYDALPSTSVSNMLNRSTYMDEDTQMPIDDNIEYDLNEDYVSQTNLNGNNFDSKLPKDFNQLKQEKTNNNNQNDQNNSSLFSSNFSFKLDQNSSHNDSREDIKPSISNMKNESQPSTSLTNSKKSRVNRADSSTVLSYTDTLDNENNTNSANNKKAKNSKKSKSSKKNNKKIIASESEEETKEEKSDSENDTDRFSNDEPDDDENYEEYEYEEPDSINLKKSKAKSKNKKTKNSVKEDEEDEENNSSEFEDEEAYDDEEDYYDDDDDDFNINSKKTKTNKKNSRASNHDKNNSKKSSSKRPVRSCRTASFQNFDNKENDNEYISLKKSSKLNQSTSDQEHIESNTKTKSKSSDKKSIKEYNNHVSASSSTTYPTRSSKRARKTYYREFSSSEEQKSSDDEHLNGYKSTTSKKKIGSRKKPRFSSSENLNV